MTTDTDIAGTIQAYVSDDRDREEERRQANWREGWRACQLHEGERYEEGFTDGLLARRTAQHDFVSEVRNETRMWGPGGRAHYAGPRPGDYAGGPVAPW